MVMQEKPDVILMDLHLQQNDIFRLTSAFSHIDPPPAIILLSMSDERKYHEGALKAGARAVVLKQKAGEEIIPILMNLFPGEIGSPYLQETEISGKNT
jgi:DNA-binding NarL/FixJ family response regulator